MTNLAFTGSDKLTEAIDAAVRLTSTPAITDQLRHSLCRMMRDHEVTLPTCVMSPVEGRYARRLLHLSEAHGYCVVAMTWGPGQGTPIHDHSGMWCVEGVWHGALEVVQYEPVGESAGLHHFQPVGSIQAGHGSAGSLIPPHEYHAIRNPSEKDIAISVHIYEGEMSRCNVFLPIGDGLRYRRSERELVLDSM
ncbi:cysteine dioxygenase family protein [Frateuria sp. Soil773]|uniref:cysteine dioxygenase family protein n=1 Tax=Frateuria sp. Soil773 TaxID=1736407 RepID=UPI0009EB4DC1|nr:cysteine dioxygenase family protein [Frateuria sp. Soil773]